MLIMGAVNGFFSGRGQTWTVLAVEGFGTAVNVALALVLMLFQRSGKLDMTFWQNIREDNLPPYVEHELPDDPHPARALVPARLGE